MSNLVGRRAEITSHSDNHLMIQGARVAVHPATDTFMRGIRYGRVTKVGRKYVHIYSETFQRTVKVLLENVEVI
jgi:hypothetical protein